jgi:hypothetical protein
VCLENSDDVALITPVALSNRRTPAHRSSTAFKTTTHGSAKNAHKSFSMGHINSLSAALDARLQAGKQRVGHSQKNIRVRAGSVDARFFGDHSRGKRIDALTLSAEVCYPNVLSALLTSFWSVDCSRSRTTTRSRSQSFG